MTEQSTLVRLELRRSRSNAARKDIQALRAIAVGLVVLNHLWPDRLPGGYIGVDVFFVISGYLITKHLVAQLDETGGIRLGEFYARRAKRLLPAALLVGGVSLAAAWVMLPFPRWAVIAQESLASAFYVENWVLAAKSVDYSAHNEQASTVQHYWSLSVEEQFYLLWPLLLLGLFVLAGRKSVNNKVILLSGTGLVFAGSLAFSIYFTEASKSQAYFVTPTRAWEFAAGALIALAATMHVRRSSGASLRFVGTLQWLGYGLIFGSALVLNEQSDFPGYIACVPVLGTLLVLASGPRGPFWSPNVPLAAGPIQYLGDISYSLYLWHWPLIVLGPNLLSRELTTTDLFGLLAVALLLSGLTKKFVEDPGRSKLLAGSKPRVTLLSMAAAMSVMALLCGALLAGAAAAQSAETKRIRDLQNGPCYGGRSMNPENDCPGAFGDPLVENVGPAEAPWFSEPECKPASDPISVQGKRYLNECDFTNGKQGAPDVWLVGDSHAEQWKVGIIELARKNGWRLHESLLGGCPVVDATRVAFMDVRTRSTVVQQRCLEWSRLVSERIIAEKPDTVFVSSFASKETVDDGSGASQLEQYAFGVRARIGAWAANGTRIFLLRDTPLTLKTSTPECLARNRGNALACANDRATALPPDPMAEGVRKLGSPNAHVLDLSDQFCDPRSCYAAIGGLHVYFDADHVSRSYIRSLQPVLESRFRAASG